MSVLCKDWIPTVTDRETVASLPLDKDLTLSVSLASLRTGRMGEPLSNQPYGVEQGDARVLILSAFVDDVTLFELRFWDGRLRLNGGTRTGQESEEVLGAVYFNFEVSYSPAAGGLAIVASWFKPSGDRATHTFTANISNLKLPSKARYYTLRLGAPVRFVDLPLFGWKVNATYDLAAPVVKPPASTDARTSRANSALVEVAPLETLRLALQSIDSWRKVAEGALRALEGGAQ